MHILKAIKQLHNLLLIELNNTGWFIQYFIIKPLHYLGVNTISKLEFCSLDSLQRCTSAKANMVI